MDLNQLREHMEMKTERISTHSHIQNLGLDSSLSVVSRNYGGLVGQERARRGLGLVAEMVKEGRIAGRAVLLSGPPGSGKTALAQALALTLSADSKTNVPFIKVSGAEVHSQSISKSEVLTQWMRRAIAVRISEETEILEGEVTEITIDRSATNPLGPKCGKITLKTTDMECMYELGAKMIETMVKEHITAGDIISIDKANGKITKLGRSYIYSKDYDAMGSNTRFLGCPTGELQKRKMVNHAISLHEVDVINSRSQGYMALFDGDSGEIKQETRSLIDEKVNEWKEEGKASLISGILFIDEVHVMDMECFSFLARALELENAPLVVMASNRGMSRVIGIDGAAGDLTPHGIPVDLLDRLVVISLDPMTDSDVKEIIKLRAQEEDVHLSAESVILLNKIAHEDSLRYACNLLVFAELSRQQENRRAGKPSADNPVAESHVTKAFSKVFSGKRSKKWLQRLESTLSLKSKSNGDEVTPKVITSGSVEMMATE